MTEAVLPYPDHDGPTVGHSGTDTSKARAVREGTRAAGRQAQTMKLMEARAHVGATVKDLRDYTGWHHGTASAVLSNLHKAGRLAMTEAKRNGCHVYMLPEIASEKGFRSLPHGGRRKETVCPQCGHRFTREEE